MLRRFVPDYDSRKAALRALGGGWSGETVTDSTDTSLGLCLRWTQRSLAVARRLNAGECDASYLEACLLVSGLASGLAALAWPGTGRDKARFAEAWVRLADPQLGTQRISLPALKRTLLADGNHADGQAIIGLRPQVLRQHSCRVLTGQDVDADEAEVVTACPSMAVTTIRQHSYSALFYTHVRSAVVHEYAVGDHAETRATTQRDVMGVSYSNCLTESGAVLRRIFFHFEWLAAVVSNVAASLDSAGDSFERAEPTRWWLHGG